MEKQSLMADLKAVLFSPKRFFENRFLKISGKRIFILCSLSMGLGLIFGSGLTYLLSIWVKNDFANNPNNYTETLKNLQLSALNFSEMLNVQQAYNVMIASLAALIIFMAPHLLGGALFGFLWMFTKPELELSFPRVLECAAISLTAMFWYIIPGLGSIIAMVMVMTNLSRALAVQYQIFGFMKALAIFSAVYLCFFLGSTSLQLLAAPFSKWLLG